MLVGSVACKRCNHQGKTLGYSLHVIKLFAQGIRASHNMMINQRPSTTHDEDRHARLRT